MKCNTFRVLAVALILAACGSDNPAEATLEGREAAFAMNERLGRGVNFGNALEAPREGDWGITLQGRHFQRAAEAGFATIRLPVRWSAHTLPAPPYTIDPGFFSRIDWAIAQAFANDLNLILNVHHYEGMDADPQNHVDRWVAIWRQIATRYANRPDNLIFELFNEPHDRLTASVWNEALVRGIEAVRESNPDRIVVVGPASWNNTNALSALRLPDDDNLIVTVHMYEPFRFTHQGASWASGSDAWLGTTWTATDAQKAEITDILERAANWGVTNDRPIFLGEFGAYSAADMDSRARWTSHVSREAERLDMSWAYWEFMSGFGLYNPGNDTFRDPLKEALLPSE